MPSMNKAQATSAGGEGAVADGGALPSYLLRLYVTGPSSISVRAIVNARRVCEQHLKGRYRLEIVNVAENIAMATRDQIVAAPTLIKFAPPPLKRFIGDMSNAERLVKGLDVHATNKR